jgi:hypothetical protein
MLCQVPEPDPVTVRNIIAIIVSLMKLVVIGGAFVIIIGGPFVLFVRVFPSEHGIALIYSFFRGAGLPTASCYRRLNTHWG